MQYFQVRQNSVIYHNPFILYIIIVDIILRFMSAEGTYNTPLL